jgi:hypothetical protein
MNGPGDVDEKNTDGFLDRFDVRIGLTSEGTGRPGCEGGNDELYMGRS